MDTDGQPIKKKESIKYLGALLHATGQISSEIDCKIGIANQEFNNLQKIWKHTNMSQRRKIELYKSLILSKFLYGLQTVWLSKALRRRIDGFYYTCLRQILGIPHPYISRISNKNVLRQANDIPLHQQLLQQQLQFYGRLMHNGEHPIHTILQGRVVKRRPGRPHLSWKQEIDKHIQNMHLGDDDWQHPGHWRKIVRQYCSLEV